MDDDLQSLEAELKRLRPREPSTHLLARLERDLAENDVAANQRDVGAPAIDARPGSAGLRPASERPADGTSALPLRPSASSRWPWWAALPVAAALAVAIWQNGRGPTVPAAPIDKASAPALALTPPGAARPASDAGLKPIRVENLLVEASDEGLVTLADGTRARRERLQYVDTIVWKNARTNASLTWSVPREEVRVVPVSFQ